MNKSYVTWAGIFGFLAVILGALAAHALKSELNAEKLNSFETGVRYQMYHALFLLVLSTQQKLQNRTLLIMVISGVFCFSFSIYLLSLKELMGLEWLSFLGPVTPIGGLLLIGAWAVIIVKGVRKNTVS